MSGAILSVENTAVTKIGMHHCPHDPEVLV